MGESKKWSGYGEQPVTSRMKDLTGHHYGRWEVLKFLGRPNGTFALWACRCGLCLKEFEVRSGNLKVGRSYGCSHCTSQRLHTTHGKSRDPRYAAWRDMLGRCYNPKTRSYPLYGGRGITVCDAWRGEDGLTNFLNQVGERPGVGYSLDRVNVDGNYEPGNVRWATDTEQMRNRRDSLKLTLNGKTLGAMEWSERLGIKRVTIGSRLRNGWDDKTTLTTPVQTKFRNKNLPTK
jgi:hypothetical protein